MKTYTLIGWYDKHGYKLVNYSMCPKEVFEEKAMTASLAAIKQECETRGKDWAESVGGVFSAYERKNMI